MEGYNDETLMPFGLHRNKRLIDVPGSYLIWLYENTNLTDTKLKVYIKDNYQALKKEK